MNDGIGLAEALLGLPGFRVLDVTETVSEVVMAVETTAVRGRAGGADPSGRGAGVPAGR